ncbi:inorganic pyrophosphatase [Ignicoccus islandicus DSM 13165]|uniref:Inorganic pyrophosphatase n=1 Tax=Ignicoccus islandicus DSM 13165 TaxID=940295 RepID=A0A0U3FM32_9CREN|nr:inorganic diphosphatase [Ignicoccus islandicus]ALU11455.1 inorganic pyrophosphatase [Ignicoccus islandicus DSM 13165]
MVNLDKLGPGEKAPEVVNVVIEIPMGGYVKYEMDKETGFIKVDRVLYTAMYYPFNYGFIPATLEEDGDPVDVLVISHDPFYPGTYVKARPIGVLVMEDEEGPDSKIIAVPVEKVDPRFKEIRDVSDLDDLTKDKIKHFFEHYKELEPGKWVKIKDWLPKEEAYKKIKEAIERYNSKSK